MIFDRFRGILPDVEGEGTHFRVPWVQTPHVMDIRTRPRTISSVTGTKGGWHCNACGERQQQVPHALSALWPPVNGNHH